MQLQLQLIIKKQLVGMKLVNGLLFAKFTNFSHSKIFPHTVFKLCAYKHYVTEYKKQALNFDHIYFYLAYISGESNSLYMHTYFNYT